ncbi:MAG: cytidine deaminase [Ignavibacteriae bacterium]|nr:cytidine deaminase [Ignavibacteriota bacterium]
MKKRARVVSSAYKGLIETAHLAKQKAYAPYSRFRVGAALLTDDDTVFVGCNVENSSYSLTICAERNAVFKAVCEGYTKFKAIAIVSDDAELLPPCGACRQVLSEFAPKLPLIMTTAKGKVKITSLDKLFPMPADLKKLAK